VSTHRDGVDAWFRVDDVGWLDDEYVVVLQALGESGWQRGDPGAVFVRGGDGDSVGVQAVSWERWKSVVMTAMEPLWSSATRTAAVVAAVSSGTSRMCSVPSVRTERA
jgi:hypothetical protein